MCQKWPKSNCEEYSGGRWYAFHGGKSFHASIREKKKKEDELRQIMNQKVKIFLFILLFYYIVLLYHSIILSQ